MACKLVIPELFGACGEDGQYCSSECYLRALLAKGAPRPWSAEKRYKWSVTQTTRPVLRIPSRWPETCEDETTELYHYDTELIVAAVNRLPELLDKIDTLEKQYETCFKERAELEKRLYGL